MLLQCFSDFHGEAYQGRPDYIWAYVSPMAPVAVVAGDIDSKDYVGTVNEIASRFQKVICVMGNHETYHRDISWKPDASLLAPNVAFLDPGVCEYEDVVFIGATMWTDFKNGDFFVMHNAKDHINDFRVVRNGEHRHTPAYAADVHRKEKAYLKMMIEKYRGSGKKIVMVTHFLPSYELVHPKWKAAGSDNLNYYFSASCDDLIEYSEAAAWVMGHTHDRRDMVLHGVRCICNPIGYPRENPDYQDMIIEV